MFQLANDFLNRLRVVSTRETAIRDGSLLDVTDTAHEAGFRWSVALTRAVWSDCVEWSSANTQAQVSQHEADRLWDVLWLALLALLAARNAPDAAQHTTYRLYRVPSDGRTTKPRLVRLHMRAHPGDDVEPVITISLYSEAQL